MNLLNEYRRKANVGESYNEIRCYYQVGYEDEDIKYFLNNCQKASRINVARIHLQDILAVIDAIKLEAEDVKDFDHCLVIQKPNLNVALSTKKTGIYSHSVFLSLVNLNGRTGWVLDAYSSGRFKSYYFGRRTKESVSFRLVRGLSEELKECGELKV